jgi:hypothetical protein
MLLKRQKLYQSVDQGLVGPKKKICVFTVVVYRSSETSTNQSDVIIRSDDRFLNLVVDSDSIVSKIYMLNFVLWLGFFFCLHTHKNIAVISQLFFFCPHTDKHLAILSKCIFDTQSIHIFGLVYYLSIYQVLHIWKTIFCFVLF